MYNGIQCHMQDIVLNVNDVDPGFMIDKKLYQSRSRG